MPGTAFSTSNWTGYDEQSVSNPGSALTDFTLLIDVSRLSSDWKSEVQSDGADIRLTKGDDTELPYDLIDWAYNAGAPTGWIRVKWSSTLASSGTQNVRVWAGYTGGTAVGYDASETFGSDNAYDANWLQYLPLDGDANDRTENANHGTLTSLAFPTDEIAGQVGGALDLDGSGGGNAASPVTLSGDCIESLPNDSTLEGSDAFTVLAWIKAASQSQSAEDTIFSNWDGVKGSLLFRYDSVSNQLDSFVHDGASNSASNAVSIEGAWHHWAARLGSGTCTTYLDGSALGNAIASIGSLAPSTTDDPAVWGGTPHVGTDGWLGGMDELQVHTAARSADWIDQEFDQSNDQATFWGTWTWNAAGVGGGTPKGPLGQLVFAGPLGGIF